MGFELTLKQKEALGIIKRAEVENLLLYGGSQSGKSFFSVYYILMRALKYEGSVHVVCRKRLVDVKSTIVLQQLHDVLKCRFPDTDFFKAKVCKMRSGSPMYLEFSNGSKIYFMGLDGVLRITTTTITTFLIDHASEFSYDGFVKLQMVLSQNNEANKVGIVTLCPTSKKCWVYRLFFEKVNPKNGELLSNEESYESLQMNPHDNLENLSEDYIKNLEGLGPKEKERFLYGRFSDVN
jgi:phage terminase large subunit